MLHIDLSISNFNCTIVDTETLQFYTDFYRRHVYIQSSPSSHFRKVYTNIDPTVFRVLHSKISTLLYIWFTLCSVKSMHTFTFCTLLYTWFSLRKGRCSVDLHLLHTVKDGNGLVFYISGGQWSRYCIILHWTSVNSHFL